MLQLPSYWVCGYSLKPGRLDIFICLQETRILSRNTCPVPVAEVNKFVSKCPIKINVLKNEN